jgi:hypothetical protein
MEGSSDGNVLVFPIRENSEETESYLSKFNSSIKNLGHKI